MGMYTSIIDAKLKLWVSPIVILVFATISWSFSKNTCRESSFLWPFFFSVTAALKIRWCVLVKNWKANWQLPKRKLKTKFWTLFERTIGRKHQKKRNFLDSRIVSQKEKIFRHRATMPVGNCAGLTCAWRKRFLSARSFLLKHLQSSSFFGIFELLVLKLALELKKRWKKFKTNLFDEISL